MSHNYKVMDEKTWERTMHCMVFRNNIEPAFIYLNQDTELFKVVHVPMQESIKAAFVYPI